MTQEKIKQIHRWYSWILAAVLAALGVLFILSCLDIYTSGHRPYSPEAIALRFQRIKIPVFLSIAGIVGGIGLNLLLPVEPKRPRSKTSPEDMMLRLRKKAGIPPVEREIRLRHILRCVTAYFFVALMIYPAVYCLTPGNFSVLELNADIIKAILITLIPAAIGLVLCGICRALVNKSFLREADLYKQALVAGQRSSSPDTAEEKKCSCTFIPKIRLLIFALAFVFIILGIYNGGADDVLKKAIAICTECIGLG